METTTHIPLFQDKTFCERYRKYHLGNKNFTIFFIIVLMCWSFAFGKLAYNSYKNEKSMGLFYLCILIVLFFTFCYCYFLYRVAMHDRVEKESQSKGIVCG
jgi:peptidoglycan/LPS O-acetylase OafA/YrhL